MKLLRLMPPISCYPPKPSQDCNHRLTGSDPNIPSHLLTQSIGNAACIDGHDSQIRKYQAPQQFRMRRVPGYVGDSVFLWRLARS